MYRNVQKCAKVSGSVQKRISSVHFSLLYTSLFCALLLSACSSVKERQDNALDLLDSAKNTASGAMNGVLEEFEDVLQKGKTVTDGVNDMVDDAKRRMDQVQSGVNMMMDGKEMIEGGVKGSE